MTERDISRDIILLTEARKAKVEKARFYTVRNQSQEEIFSHPELTSHQKVIALFLLTRTNSKNGGKVWWSSPRIARQLGCSRRSVDEAKKKLISLGFLEQRGYVKGKGRFPIKVLAFSDLENLGMATPKFIQENLGTTKPKFSRENLGTTKPKLIQGNNLGTTKPKFIQGNNLGTTKPKFIRENLGTSMPKVSNPENNLGTHVPKSGENLGMGTPLNLFKKREQQRTPTPLGRGDGGFSVKRREEPEISEMSIEQIRELEPKYLSDQDYLDYKRRRRELIKEREALESKSLAWSGTYGPEAWDGH